MLTDTEVVALRESVRVAHQRRPIVGPSDWVMHVGGPLDGIRSRVTLQAMRGVSVGWASNTRRGLIMANYKPDGGVLQWVGFEVIGVSMSSPMPLSLV